MRGCSGRRDGDNELATLGCRRREDIVDEGMVKVSLSSKGMSPAPGHRRRDGNGELAATGMSPAWGRGG